MKALPFLATVLLAIPLGCSHRIPVGTVEVIDTSLSITPRAEKATMDAVRAQIGRMERGDILILVPITGDELNDVGGRILRLEAPRTRESYDADMRRFRKDAAQRLGAWVAIQRAEPDRTDILGSLDLARQEIDSIPEEDRRRVVVVSDFLEDDPTYRFVSIPQLASATRARAFAARLRADRKFVLAAVPVCLGRLESRDFASLSPRRKEAVDAFWTEYLSDRGNVPMLRFDGTGMLAGDFGCSSQSASALTQSGKGE